MVRRLFWEAEVWSPLAALCFAGACCVLAGCGDWVHPPSAEESARFEMAGPSGLSVDIDRLVQAKIPAGPYHTVAGDVLQLQLEMPSRMPDGQVSGGAAVSDGRESYTCRVSDDGTVLFPVVGRIPVAGRSLAEIETVVGAAFYPRYVKTPVPVYASVVEYSTRRVSVVGAVAKPGIYPLRHEQMSLVALLMEAGGIVEKGAAVIRVSRQDRMNPPLPEMRSPALSQSANGQTLKRRLTVPAAYTQQRDVAVSRAQYETPAVPIYAVFEHEGPLNTTGWLALENESDVQFRMWLDIGNTFQRRSWLAVATTAGAAGGAQEDLAARLARLAEFLESGSRGQAVPLTVRDAGWQKTDTGLFRVSLSMPVIHGGRLAGANPGQMAGPAGKATEGKTLILPVKGLNIPFTDVVLEEGDSVIVEWPDEQYVSVLGLVGKPGNFPYPPTAKYTLVQAIAFAGGLDSVADPRYVSVYRLRMDGTIASTTVQLVNSKDKEHLTQALAMPLKPGDVVSVEHTLRTRTNVFFDRIFRVSLGLYLNPDTFWQ